jgi:type II secretory pathway pseudopilin PulG
MMSVLLAATVPRVSGTVAKARLSRATQMAGADLEFAVSTASRQRRPVVITRDVSTRGYTVTDRLSGTAFLRRSFAVGTDMTLDSAVVTPSSVQIFPGGLVSAPMALTLWTGGTSRTISLTAEGRVVLP